MILKSKNLKVILITFFSILFYAILRYNIFSNIPWIDFPVYIFNKVIALTSIFMILYYQLKPTTTSGFKEYLWNTMFLLIIFHILLSIIILMPEYYEKFYDGYRLNVIGSLSLLFGVLAFLGIFMRGIISIQSKVDNKFPAVTSHLIRLKFFTLFLIAGHLFVMGINGWMTPHKWPGYLPPISLIAFVLLTISIILFVFQNRR